VTPTRPPDNPAPHAGRGTGALVWLVRHAEVADEWRGKAYGGLDVPLSPAGEERTLELARDLAALPPDALLSSPLQRARRLADAVANSIGLPPSLHDGLREIDRGEWQGLTVRDLHARHADDVAAFYRDPWSWRGHGGESDEDVVARAWPPLEAALGVSRVLVVATHYNVLRTLTASALAVPPVRSFALRVDKGRAVLLRDAPAGWELLASNARHPGRSTTQAG